MTGLSKDGKVWMENLGLSSETLHPWGTSSSVGTARAHSQGPASQAASYRREGRATSTPDLLPSPQSQTKQTCSSLLQTSKQAAGGVSVLCTCCDSPGQGVLEDPGLQTVPAWMPVGRASLPSG